MMTIPGKYNKKLVEKQTVVQIRICRKKRKKITSIPWIGIAHGHDPAYQLDVYFIKNINDNKDADKI